jgi:mono/diheme cytochrome c family protein
MMRRIWLIGSVALGLVLGGHLGFVGAQDQAGPKKLNPFTGNPEAIKEGRQLYFLYGCSGCHGRSGGGGMGRPVIDDEWTFGSDDETLFKLIENGRSNSLSHPSQMGSSNQAISRQSAHHNKERRDPYPKVKYLPD